MTDKMREEFETWAKRKWIGISLLRVNQPGTPRDGQYEAQAAKDCWEAWQASRAAVVIELPETPNRGIGYGLFDAAKERCATVIEAAGLKVKQ